MRLSAEMSNATKSSPPVFEESTQTWVSYKKELKMWRTLTSLDKAKQGPALYLSLKGKAKEVVSDIDADEIAAENGLDCLIEALDSIYKRDENQEAYLAYKQFEEFKRPKNMPVKDYIIKFESLHSKLKSFKMNLPEGVKAYRLLQSGNMSDEETRLCLATIAEFKYEDMKRQVMKICGDEVSSSMDKMQNLSLKEEPVFAVSNDGIAHQSEVFVNEAHYYENDSRQPFNPRSGNGQRRGRGGTTDLIGETHMEVATGDADRPQQSPEKTLLPLVGK